jgi:hypothetical protein
MTELAESVKIGLLAVEESKKKCWFCEKKTQDGNKKTDVVANGQTDEGEDIENELENKSSTLGSNLNDEPSWSISNPDPSLLKGNKKNIKAKAAAHHCIPGNASMMNHHENKLVKHYMKEGGKYNHIEDIGYDINDAANGVWLPGNYDVRKKNGWGKTWSACDASFQVDYAKSTMEKAKWQFHDAHEEYSEHVVETLDEIYNQLEKTYKKQKKNCPVCGKDLSTQKRTPPYGLVGRLNFVSGRYRSLLRLSPKNKKHVANGYYTSTLVKNYYKLP